MNSSKNKLNKKKKKNWLFKPMPNVHLFSFFYVIFLINYYVQLADFDHDIMWEEDTFYQLDVRVSQIIWLKIMKKILWFIYNLVW